MTDYAPIVPPAVTWSNSWSTAFVDLLSIVSAAKVVFVVEVDPDNDPTTSNSFPVVATAANAPLAQRAKSLLTRELVARLGTGSMAYSPDWDPLIDPAYNPIGPSIADDFARRATAVNYQQIGGSTNRFSVPVPRASGLETVGLFDRDAAIAAYQPELAAVLAALPQLVADLATQAALNTAQDPTAATTVAAALHRLVGGVVEVSTRLEAGPLRWRANP